MKKEINHIPEETLQAFMCYSWPGNVRELQNLVERAVILSSNGVLPNTLPEIEDSSSLPSSQRTFNDSHGCDLAKTLESTGWKLGGPTERRPDSA